MTETSKLLSDVVFCRLRYIGGFRTEGEIAMSVIRNCPNFKTDKLHGNFVREVRDVLWALRNEGKVLRSVKGEWAALDRRKDEKRRKLLQELHSMLEGTEAMEKLKELIGEIRG